MTEHYRLSFAPVLVIDLRTIFGRYRWHDAPFNAGNSHRLPLINRSKPNCRKNSQHHKDHERAQLRDLKRGFGLRGGQRLEHWYFLKELHD